MKLRVLYYDANGNVKTGYCDTEKVTPEEHKAEADALCKKVNGKFITVGIIA